MTHPLEDEDVLISVTLQHIPTKQEVTKHILAPADGPPDVFGATEQATEQALDALLVLIENQGG